MDGYKQNILAGELKLLFIVNEHYSSPKPQKNEDSYGIPSGSPIGPKHPSPPSISRPPASTITNQHQGPLPAGESSYLRPPSKGCNSKHVFPSFLPPRKKKS